MKKRIPFLLTVFLCIFIVGVATISSEKVLAASKPKLSAKKKTIYLKKSYTLKMKGTKKKVSWSIKSGKKYIKLSKKKKTSVKITGKKSGTAVVIAKIGKKKYSCTVKVKKKRSSNSTNTSQSNSTNKPGSDKVTGTPGKNVSIASGKNVFQMGTKKLALGMSFSDAKTVFGTLSNESVRQGIAPQGFKSLSYHNEDYTEYVLAYFQRDKIVSLFGIGKELVYGSDIVSTGLAASKLAAAGWYPDNDWYTTSDGNTACYANTFGSDNVLAFTDYHHNNDVYAIQVYRSDFSFQSMTVPVEISKYTSKVLDEMILEFNEMLTSYRYWLSECSTEINANMSKYAQYQADYLVKSSATEAVARSSSVIKAGIKQTVNPYATSGAEFAYGGCQDAIGFFNSLVEDKTAANELKDFPYYIWGTSASAWGSDDTYTFMVIDVCN